MVSKTFASTVLLYNDVAMEITQEYYGKIVKKSVSYEMDGICENLL